MMEAYLEGCFCDPPRQTGVGVSVRVRWGVEGECEGDTEMRPLVYRDSLRQGQAEWM